MGYRVAVQDASAVRTIDVRALRTTVGTAAECGLRLRAPGVAPVHAVLRMESGGLLVDAQGASAVQVDGLRVLSATLDVGRVVQLGEARIHVIGPSDAPAWTALWSDIRDRAQACLPRTAAAAAVGVSVVLHAILILALGSILFAKPKRIVDSSIALSLAERAERLEIPEALPKQDPVIPVQDAVKLPDDPLPLFEPEPLDLLAPPTPQETPEPALPEPPRKPPPSLPSSHPNEDPKDGEPPGRTSIGLGASPGVHGDGPGGPSIPGQSFGKGDAASGNQRVAEILGSDPGGARALGVVRGKASAARVWVVKGDYDQAELVLEALGIAHAPCTKEIIEQNEIPAHVRVLFFNCTGKVLAPHAQERVARWVADGGYLVSTDWGVERLIERGFPGTIVPLRRGGRDVLTPDETVEVRASDERHALLAGVPRTEQIARWWLEDTSIPFEVAAEPLPDAQVQVLVRSETLRRRHGTPVVAAVFRHGKGRVMHLLGHVYQKEGNLRGAYLVQRMVVNYLEEALTR